MEEIELPIAVMTYDIISNKIISICNKKWDGSVNNDNANSEIVDTRKLRVIDAILSTSAAPTYFPVNNFKIAVDGDERHFSCVDGGIWANDPSLYSLFLRRLNHVHPPPSDIEKNIDAYRRGEKLLQQKLVVYNIIAFGTGKEVISNVKYKNWSSTSSWLVGSPNVIDVILSASSSMNHVMLKELDCVPGVNYVKVNMDLHKKIDLDDHTSVDKQEALIELNFPNINNDLNEKNFSSDESDKSILTKAEKTLKYALNVTFKAGTNEDCIDTDVKEVIREE